MVSVCDKDWILNTLSHRESERVPFNFSFVPPVQRRLEEYYSTNDLEQTFGLPIRMSGPKSIKPLYAHPDDFGATATDEFGVVWATNPNDRGQPIGTCLSEPELGAYSFPDARSTHRYDGLPEWCTANAEHFLVLWVGDLWERATFMRGMENLLLDVVHNRTFVADLLWGIATYVLETMEVLDTCSFDCIALSDDYGSQKAMLISPDTWRELVKPCLRAVYAKAKQQGRYVFHHSCGNIEPIIPDLIDVGLDVLHPIQPEAMDILRLKREFGRDLCFCGGVGTQQLLVGQDCSGVREHVKMLKSEMGRDGGYILEPGITVQVDVPLGNIVAMVDEVLRW